MLDSRSKRYDNKDGKECEKCNNVITKDGREFQFDDSPLSDFGKQIATNMQPLIAAIPVKYFYASPFERTVDTAHLILGKSHPDVQIRLEPGLVESLHRSGKSDPGFKTVEELEEHHKRIDKSYVPIYSRQALIHHFKEGGWIDHDCDDAKFGGRVGYICKKWAAIEDNSSIE